MPGDKEESGIHKVFEFRTLVAAAAAAVFHKKGTEMGVRCQGRMSSLGPDEFEVHMTHLDGMSTDSPIQGSREG